MPIVTYFAVVGTALLALLFYADATMEPRGPLAVTTSFEGLPAPWHGPAIQSVASASAPEPDMNSDAVKAAAPAAVKTASAADLTTGSGQPAAAEIAPKKKKHIARKYAPPREDNRHYAWQSGGGNSFGLFGRF
jgi:hypothetical protein